MKIDVAAAAQQRAAAAAALACGERGRIRALLDAGRIEAALRAVEDLVESVICEPLNTAEIFADAGLDDACQRAGAACLRELRPASHDTGERVPVVFVASRLQASGGHTAVLADIARLAGGPARILLTGVGGRTNTAGLSHLFGGIPDLQFETAPRASRLERLRWVQSRLAALRPETVWLFNHHQDSVAVAAVQPGQGYQLKFLHHGDHHLCLGVCLPFGEHYDPHAMGWRNCREVLQRSDNLYLPMAVAVPVVRQAHALRSGPLVTCTAAGRNKIEHDYWPAYAEVVASSLARTGGTHIHIGRLSAPYRWRIRRALRGQGVQPARFRYIPRVRSVAAALVQEGVDVYLSSFPYPGARTLVEAMAAGLPVAVHDHSGKRFLGALDMAPPGSCVWSDPEELFAFLQRTDRTELRRLGELSRRHYDANHTPQAMEAALRAGAAPAPVPLSHFPHRRDPLAEALRRSRHLSLHGVFGRWILRTARWVRSTFS